jgi:hypothetical protein
MGFLNGESGGDRTLDNTIKSRVLYQLSYRLTRYAGKKKGELTDYPWIVKHLGKFFYIHGAKSGNRLLCGGWDGWLPPPSPP